MLIILAAFWAMVYATPVVVEGLYQDYVSQILKDVSYHSMVLTWLLPLLVAYAWVFLCSATTDNPVKAAGIAVAAGLLAMFAVVAVSRGVPLVEYSWRLVLKVGLDHNGTILRMTVQPRLQLIRIGCGGALIGVFLTVTWVLVGRLREFSVGWRGLPFLGLVAFGVVLWGSRLLPQRDPEPTPPLDVLRITGEARDLAVTGSTAYVLTEAGLTVVDAARGDSLSLRGQLALGDGWSLSELSVQDDVAYAVGTYEAQPADSSAVVAIDVADPAGPRLTHICPLGSSEQLGAVVDMASTDETVLVGVVGATESSLLSLVADKTGRLNAAGRLVLETYANSHTGILTVYANGIPRRHHASPHVFRMHIADGHAFIGLRSGLAVIDVGHPGRLAELARFELEDSATRMRRGPRSVVVAGERVYVERRWPLEMVVLDASRKDQPVEVSTSTWGGSHPYRGARISGERLYLSSGRTIEVYPVTSRPGTARPIQILGRPETAEFEYSEPILSDGLMYALMQRSEGSYLTVFRVDPLRGADTGGHR